jgi:hypothetical protein
MTNVLASALIVVLGVAIGLAMTLPRVRRTRKRSTDRIIRRELTHDGATYSVDLRKGEAVWKPGQNGRVQGPGRATYTREDLSEGVIYHLELVSDDGAAARYTGPVPPSFVEGSEAQTRYRTLKKWAPLFALVLIAFRLGCVVLGIVVADVASDRWGLPWWARFLVALAVFALLRGLGTSLKVAARRRAAALDDGD